MIYLFVRWVFAGELRRGKYLGKMLVIYVAYVCGPFNKRYKPPPADYKISALVL